MPALSFLQSFIQRQNLSIFTPVEIKELEHIILNAVNEELDSPKSPSYLMQLGISAYVPSPKVLSLLEAEGFHFVKGQSFCYLDWNRFLTR